MTIMTTTRMLTALTLLFAAGAAAAESDPLRCEARQMRAESEFYRCLSRCDRRVERSAARPAERADATNPVDCEAVCGDRLDADLARIADTAPCTVAEATAPSPRECEARMLRIASNDLRCQARCGRQRHREGFERSTCLDTCRTRCGIAVDTLSAEAICAGGRMGSGEMCAAD
ncbi:MAG: hypothetical protein SF182_16980 [Deltaproteobacteria bacterium]|nr:hypothetical protein [Deltaproteobacteria bacterium]